ncbi:MAG: Hcp family type VI secretion system effector [Pseudomonadota bacterium]
MALTSYLKLEGNNQGAIEGDCTQKGHEKWILVYAVEHNLEIPRDINTGLPTGQRVHKPLVITKRTDPATPLLYQACASGEQMKTWQLDYHTINEKGQEVLYYQITLTNAIVVNIKHYKLHTMVEANKALPDQEDVSFTYEAITWENKIANKQAVDDWKNPVSA